MNQHIHRARPLGLMAASFALLSASPIAHAQVAPFELQPVTITGSGMPRSLGGEIAATSVLTRGDIERSGARDAVQVLNLLGTALVEQQGGPGTLASVRIRGADSRDTLVLVDGVPLTDVTTGQASIEEIPAEMIERVEVVRGNMSALYGANATGGVIQIFTRRGKAGVQARASVGGGSRGTDWANASVGAGNERFSARVGVGLERTSGFSAADPATAPTANPDRDGNKRHHATLAADAELAPGQRVSLDVRHVEGRVQYDSTDSFSTSTDTHASHLAQTGMALHGQHELAGDWSIGWRIARDDQKRNDDVTTGFGPYSFGNITHNEVKALELNGEPWKAWRVQAGVERLSQSTENITYLRQTRDTDVLRAGLVHDTDWGSLQANIRHDKTSDFGAATTGLLGASLKMGGHLSVIGNLSTSFTPPTLDFLFYDCAPYGVCSNPALRPEKARNAELGLQWQDAHTLARLTAFALRAHDKIQNVQDANGNLVPQNLNRVKNNGLELSMRHALQSWTLVGEASLQNPVDEDTGQRLLRRAREQFALRADYQQARWQAGAALRYVGSRPDNGGVTLASYTVVDASGRWPLADGLSLQARIDNLFDRHYQPTFGYNGTPRGAFVGLDWALH